MTDDGDGSMGITSPAGNHQGVTEAYERHQFHVVFYTLYNYCTVDLSALYLDVLKDRLYTTKKIQ